MRSLSALWVGAFALAAALAPPAQSQLCGDCDGDAVITVLDALAAARYQVGLEALRPENLDQCNPQTDDRVDVLDVLRIASLAARGSNDPIGATCPGAVDRRATVAAAINQPRVAPAERAGATRLGVVVASPLYGEVGLRAWLRLGNDTWQPITLIDAAAAEPRPVSVAGENRVIEWDAVADLAPIPRPSYAHVATHDVRVETYTRVSKSSIDPSTGSTTTVSTETPGHSVILRFSW